MNKVRKVHKGMDVWGQEEEPNQEKKEHEP